MSDQGLMPVLFVHAHALPLTILTQKNNLDWKLIGAVPFMVNWKMFGEALYLLLKRKQQIKCSQGGGGFSPDEILYQAQIEKTFALKTVECYLLSFRCNSSFVQFTVKYRTFYIKSDITFFNYIPITFYLYSTKTQQHVHQLTLCWKVKTVQ